MDLTMALDEMKRIREYLTAITVSEDTMKLYGSLSDEVAALGKKKGELEYEIAKLIPALAEANKNHAAALGLLSSSIGSAKDELAEVKAGIALAKKAAAEEVEFQRAKLADAEKESRLVLEGLKSKAKEEQSTLDEIRAAVKKITG